MSTYEPAIGDRVEIGGDASNRSFQRLLGPSYIGRKGTVKKLWSDPNYGDLASVLCDGGTANSALWVPWANLLLLNRGDTVVPVAVPAKRWDWRLKASGLRLKVLHRLVALNDAMITFELENGTVDTILESKLLKHVERL